MEAYGEAVRLRLTWHSEHIQRADHADVSGSDASARGSGAKRIGHRKPL